MPLIHLSAHPDRIGDPATARALFGGLATEHVETAAFAYLDGDRRLIGMRHTRSCCRQLVDLPLRDVAADALAFDAAALLMAHNHPSGDATPSPADREVTRLLIRTLDPLGVRLLDHLVLAAEETISFRDLGLL